MFDDIILYAGEKKTKETLAFARKLGSVKILVVFEKHTKENKTLFSALGADLLSGVLVGTSKDVSRTFGQYDYLVGMALRELVEDKKTSVIYGAEGLEVKDKTHHRSSGLNQVLAKLLAERGKTYVFSIGSLLQTDNQALLLGRMQQNKRILSKYDVKMSACSVGGTWDLIRAPKERKLFLETL